MLYTRHANAALYECGLRGDTTAHVRLLAPSTTLTTTLHWEKPYSTASRHQRHSQVFIPSILQFRLPPYNQHHHWSPAPAAPHQQCPCFVLDCMFVCVARLFLLILFVCCSTFWCRSITATTMAVWPESRVYIIESALCVRVGDAKQRRIFLEWGPHLGVFNTNTYKCECYRWWRSFAMYVYVLYGYHAQQTMYRYRSVTIFYAYLKVFHLAKEWS